ncbi:MAG: FG-GAP repeat domain-containing protein, partial [Longimicrobiales bacterium]
MQIADVNGDGRDDLVWNILNDASANRVYVGLSLVAGGFNFLTPQDHPTICSWSTYTPLIGDFNRDRASDLLWVNPANFIHGGSGQGTGRFNYATRQALTGNDNTTPGIGPFQLFTGDVDGDGARDVIWNKRSGTANRIAVTRGVTGQEVVDRSDPAQLHPDPANWLQAQMLVGDFNGDQ